MCLPSADYLLCKRKFYSDEVAKSRLLVSPMVPYCFVDVCVQCGILVGRTFEVAVRLGLHSINTSAG